MSTGLVWSEILGVGAGAPEALQVVVGLIAAYLSVVVPASAIFSFVDRKLSADLQARVGPNRAGPAGVFQSLADLIKLLQKREEPSRTGRWLLLQTVAIYASLAALPTSSGSLLLDADMSVFVPLFAALTAAAVGLLMGVESGSLDGVHGGVRGVAQALSGLFPALVSTLTVGLSVGGYRWSQIAEAQGAGPLRWLVLRDPFHFVAFLAFVVSGLILLQVAPLDGAVSWVDLRGGVSSRLQGSRYFLFRLSRIYGQFLWCCLAAVLFLGAWKLPVSLTLALGSAHALGTLHFLELSVLLVKVLGLMLLIVVAGRVTPRLRSDQVAELAWKVVSPLALVALMGSALWAAWGFL